LKPGAAWAEIFSVEFVIAVKSRKGVIYTGSGPTENDGFLLGEVRGSQMENGSPGKS
jgi:hypothetical protein